MSDSSPRSQPVPFADAWREDLCTCGGEAQHVHCPWGGAHVHYVDNQGEDIQPPEGSKLRAVVHGAAASGCDTAGGDHA